MSIAVVRWRSSGKSSRWLSSILTGTSFFPGEPTLGGVCFCSKELCSEITCCFKDLPIELGYWTWNSILGLDQQELLRKLVLQLMMVGLSRALTSLLLQLYLLLRARMLGNNLERAMPLLSLHLPLRDQFEFSILAWDLYINYWDWLSNSNWDWLLSNWINGFWVNNRFNGCNC